MWKAISLKELRETMWIGGITAILLFYWMIHETGFDILWMNPVQWQGQIPFHSDRFINASPVFTVIAACCALALGLRQTAWESMRGTYPFLLHRPISRRQLFGIKIAVGLAVQLTVTGVVILAFALWAATPGTHASPFTWSMTSWEWLLWLSMSLIYLGAFLAGIREARWFGTRLFPIITAIPLMAIAAEMPVSYAARIGIVIVTALIYLAAIFHVVQTRDYA
jgi:hypothetical protein